MVDKLKLSLKLGSYGGVLALFVSLIGMVETFGERAVISGVISLGHTLLLITGLGTGYLTARHLSRAHNPPYQAGGQTPGAWAVGSGLVAGLVAALMLAVLVVATDRFNLRSVLVNASPVLVALLTFEQDVTAGAIRLLILGAVLGAAGGTSYLLPSRVRRPLLWGLVWVALLGMLFDLLRITLTRPGWPTTVSKLLFATRGLSVRGAVIIFAWSVNAVLTLLPVWLRRALVSLLSLSLLLRLVWFIAIDTKDLPVLPDCPQLKGGLLNCIGMVGAAFGTQGNTSGPGLASFGPSMSAILTLLELLLLIGGAFALVLVIGRGISRLTMAAPAEPLETYTPDGGKVASLNLGWLAPTWQQGHSPSLQAVQKAKRFSSVYLGIAFLLFLPAILGVFPSEVMVNVGLFVLMGFGLNIVVGFAGLLDLGYVAFFAVGAYTTAVLTSPASSLGAGLSFWAALPFVVAITALSGLLVGAPVLRMRGDYLAIVTLGFGEIARFLALSDWLRPWLGGALGILDIPKPSLGGLELVGPQKLYYLVLMGSLVALFVSWRLGDSRVGRAWIAMREDEQVANAMGINTVYYKLLAFAIGAMIASLSGAVFATKLGTIFPHSFDVLVSITALSLLIMGGIGSLPGVVVGALALVGLPELLREFTEFRLLLYGGLLIVMMLVRPEGLVPSVRRARELHETERAQDDWLRQAEAVPAPANPGPST
jgi:ABC-type branched-subunit amino acid transport system permease subunit